MENLKQKIIGFVLFVVCVFVAFGAGIYFEKFQSNPKLPIYTINEVKGLEEFKTINNWHLLNVSCGSQSNSNLFDCQNTILYTENVSEINIGDLIVFYDNSTAINSTIHQYINKIGDCHITKGINNVFPDPYCTSREKIYGKMTAVIYTNQKII